MIGKVIGWWPINVINVVYSLTSCGVAKEMNILEQMFPHLDLPTF